MQEGYKLNIVLLDNHGFASIGGLSQAIGSAGLRHGLPLPDPETGQLDGEYAAGRLRRSARSLGAHAVRSARPDRR